jgi:aspartyl-tRNA(Asn)/glutamyl-tRNA(Gln) amidotransferase subunit A
MALASLGSDTGGSIRIPAAACGIVGLKPTLDEIPTDGVVPLSRTLDHVGPFARTVGDAWLVYQALVNSTDVAMLSRRALTGVRLGLPRRYFCELLDPHVRASLERAVATLERRGVRVEEVDIPHASSTPAVYVHIHAPEGSEYHARTIDTAPDRYTRTVRMRLEMGRYVLAEDHVRALQAREALRREVDEALAGCDALVLPTLPIPAPPIGAESVVVDNRSEPVRALMLRLTQLFNVTGHPAITLPNGTTPQGLPCGLQLVGRRSETAALLQVAGACEVGLADAP